jgi:hypothetical protein
LLVDLGSPLEVPRPSSLPRAEHKEYIDLMARYARRDTVSVQEIFLETAVPPVCSVIVTRVCCSYHSQGQPAVFVFQLSKVDVEALDIHLLMFHILKVRINIAVTWTRLEYIARRPSTFLLIKVVRSTS